MIAEQKISVVVPSYGCAGTLGDLVTQIEATLQERLAEVVVIDDRSPDDSWAITRRLAADGHRVRAVRLSRNFGQHAAITAGLTFSSGDVIVIMDCDLQDPPDAIPQLVEALSGADVAIAVRQGSYDSKPRRALANVYTRSLSRISSLDIDPSAGSFSAITRKVADAFLDLGDLDRHYLHLLSWLGFEWRLVPISRMQREVGHSSYSLRRRIAHALNGIAFYGRTILRWLVGFGALLFTLGVITGIALVAVRLSVGAASGWTSIFTAIIVMGGLTVLSVGIVGLYVGRVYEQSAGRPLFVIDEDTGILTQKTERPQ